MYECIVRIDLIGNKEDGGAITVHLTSFYQLLASGLYDIYCKWEKTLYCRGQLKYDGTRARTRFRLSVKRTSPFQSAGGSQFSRLLAAEVCASAVVMLDTPCFEVVGIVLATHSIRKFPLHFNSRASPCTITFQLESTAILRTDGIWKTGAALWQLRCRWKP